MNIDKILKDIITTYPTIIDLSIRTDINRIYVSIWYWVKGEFESEKTYDEVVYEKND